jgi:hypothetical protein
MDYMLLKTKQIDALSSVVRCADSDLKVECQRVDGCRLAGIETLNETT